MSEHSINHNFMNKSLLFRSIFIGAMSVVVLSIIAVPQTTYAEIKNDKDEASHTLVHNGKLTICKLDKKAYEVVRTIKKAVITGYSSAWDETTGIPGKPGFITASGFDLRELKDGEGVVANNYLPFGTKIRIPDLFGDTIFTVQDTGSPNHFSTVNRFDVYFPGELGKKEAMKFGRPTAKVEFVES